MLRNYFAGRDQSYCYQRLSLASHTPHTPNHQIERDTQLAESLRGERRYKRSRYRRRDPNRLLPLTLNTGLA